MKRAALVLILATASGCSGGTAAPATTSTAVTTTQTTGAATAPTAVSPTTPTADGGSSTSGSVETPSDWDADLAVFKPDKPDADRLTSYLDDMSRALADTLPHAPSPGSGSGTLTR